MIRNYHVCSWNSVKLPTAWNVVDDFKGVTIALTDEEVMALTSDYDVKICDSLIKTSIYKTIYLDKLGGRHRIH